ncbi:CHAD domain-containing protein [Pseudomonas akapageensis]|uniref:CHAD domain-containing protein n=1 Tax=Pseudomonas akapageensis TaxID=2609961 RepID=UPI0014075D09|nr:CHAD domain-containing protein [Pseudomonas akapageensis]
MAAMIDHVVAQIVGLQIKLLSCQARLAAQTDSEALHDLRTSVRRLRSLLRPLRGLPGVDQVEAAAKAVGELTTPFRDKEVLAAHLIAWHFPAAGAKRLAELEGVFVAVAASAELGRLLAVVDAFPQFLRAAQRQKLLRGLRRRVDKRLVKQWRKLLEALRDPAHDRHRLRLLIKRVRYAHEAYPQLDRSPAKTARCLKEAQGALGDWHDHFQWLLQAEQQADLAPCVAGWQAAMKQAEQVSDEVLDKLLAICSKQ